MSTSEKIPATDRSSGGPGSSHVDATAKHKDSAGAHPQNTPAEKKHPREDANSGNHGTRHERHEPGEGGRS